MLPAQPVTQSVNETHRKEVAISLIMLHGQGFPRMPDKLSLYVTIMHEYGYL